MNFYSIFLQLCNEAKKTPSKVVTEIGVSKSSVTRWKSGSFPSDATVQKIANYFNVPTASLTKGQREFDVYDNIIPMPTMTTVPLLGTIACGTPITAVENIEDYVAKPESIDADFALRCKGDSMVDARIFDGDIVYIHQQPTVNNGEIAAVLIDDEATLKRVYISDGTITLMPANQKYPPLIYSGEQLNNIRILGKAVAFTSVII